MLSIFIESLTKKITLWLIVFKKIRNLLKKDFDKLKKIIDHIYKESIDKESFDKEKDNTEGALRKIFLNLDLRN